MVVWIVLAVVIALLLLSGWVVDRRAAKRGYRIHVRHTGLRRHISYTRIDGDDDEPGAPPRAPEQPD